MKTQHNHRLFAPGLFGWLITLCALAFSGVAGAGTDISTADHSKFKELQTKFATGPDVTKACLACHTEAAKQVHKTKHWTWEFLNPENEQRLGKKNVMNNFCISISQNYPFCTSCHVGYGWKDKDFDFTSEVNVDCLACHDTTGTYIKPPGLAGHPVYKEMELPVGSGKIVKPADLTKVAQNVGKSSRDTCGACHFRGGGGDGVKHGDLDSSLASPDEDLDVHMDAIGLDFSCSTCHKTSSHDVPGSRYTPTAMDKGGYHIPGKPDQGNPATCTACHGNRPHPVAATKLEDHGNRLNDHTNKIACQTCHIPAMARGGVATKMSWDWSTAGKMGPDGKPMTIKDEHGHVTYDSRKGDFVLGENVIPEYAWFNGKVKYTLLDTKVDKSKEPVAINQIEGSADDGMSMIWPMKVMRGTQPFDPVNQTLVMPHTAGNDKIGYWKNFDWEIAIADGMQNMGAPFSGKVDFIKTEMYWPITHMVAPKEKAVGCTDCHDANGGRLKDVKGIYLPGSGNNNKLLDMGGWGIALLTLIGVLLHGAGRIFSSKKG